MKKIGYILLFLLLVFSVLFLCLWLGEKGQEPPSPTFAVEKVRIEEESGYGQMLSPKDNAEILSYLAALAEGGEKVYVTFLLAEEMNDVAVKALTEELSGKVGISPWYSPSDNGKCEGWDMTLTPKNGAFSEGDTEALMTLSQHALVKEIRLSRMPVAFPD